MVVFVGVIHRKRKPQTVFVIKFTSFKSIQHIILCALSCSAVPIMVYEDEVILRGITDND